MTKERMERGSRLRPLARAVLRTQSDARLVALAREGREAAFEEIVRRYRPGLVAFAAAYAPADRTEDVVQESLVRSWQALGEATEEIHLKPWLYTIVRNRARNARRDAKLHEPLSDDIDGMAQPPEIVLGREELDSVVGAVGALPEPQRQALVRSALEGHTHEQIAAALGSSPGAVRQLIYRARLNLRSGVGMLLPLPLVRLMSEYGAETTAAASGVAAGGAAIGAAGGGSALTKVAMVAAVTTIAAGAGVAIERVKDDRPAKETVVQQREDSGSGTGAPQGAATPASANSSGLGSGEDGAAGATDDRGDHESGDDSGPGSDNSGERPDHSGPGSDDSGPSASSGPSDEVRDDEDNSGPGGGGDPPEPPEQDGDSSGPGGGGGHSGSGSGSDDPPEIEPDNSGPGGGGSSGSGSSGSGSGSGSSGSGSSGSGSGEEPELY